MSSNEKPPTGQSASDMIGETADRVTVRLDTATEETVDAAIEMGVAPNQSVAIRQAIREWDPEGCK